MGRFIAFVVFVILTMNAVENSFGLKFDLDFSSYFLAPHPYDFFVRSCKFAALLSGTLYVTFVFSPWIRLKLFTTLDHGSMFQQVGAYVLTFILFVVLLGVMGVSAILTYMEVFNYAQADVNYRSIILFEYEMGRDRIYGLTKIGMQHMAEAVIHVLFVIILFIPLQMAVVDVLRESIIPWLRSFKASEKRLSVSAARGLLLFGWGLCFVLTLWWFNLLDMMWAWTSDLLREGRIVQYTVSPTEGADTLWGFSKQQVLALIDALIIPPVLFTVCILTAYLFRPMAGGVLHFVGQWPDHYQPVIKPKLVVAICSVAVWIPAIYILFPLIQKMFVS